MRLSVVNPPSNQYFISLSYAVNQNSQTSSCTCKKLNKLSFPKFTFNELEPIISSNPFSSTAGILIKPFATAFLTLGSKACGKK